MTQLAGITLFILSLLLGTTFIYGLNQWHHDWRIAHQDVPSLGLSDKVATITRVIAQIPQAHLFGRHLASGNIPITSLQMRIIGIVHTREKASSKVYISISGQPGKIYHIGDTLPNGVKVHDISSTVVIFDNDGQLEKLMIPRQSLYFKPYHLKDK